MAVTESFSRKASYGQKRCLTAVRASFGRKRPFSAKNETLIAAVRAHFGRKRLLSTVRGQDSLSFGRNRKSFMAVRCGRKSHCKAYGRSLPRWNKLLLPFQLSDVFAFEADPNARMMQLLKEGFKKQGRLPKFVENANAILDINIYNIATSRRKPIFGLEKLEENEEYAREIDKVEQVRIQIEPFKHGYHQNHFTHLIQPQISQMELEISWDLNNILPFDC